MPPPHRSAVAATPRTSAPAAAIALASLALALSACAAPAMPGANAPERPLPSDVEGTVALFDESEAELLGALGQAPASAVATPGGAGADATAPAQEPGPLAKKEAAAADSPEVVEEERDVARDPCAIACRALTSMQRAARHLCGLTGEEDSRCGNARARAAGAAQRVREACPRCSG